MDTHIKSTNENGSIAFPENFRIVKRVTNSEFNRGDDVLTTGHFLRGSYEYPADKGAVLVLSAMGWSEMSIVDKERIAVYWVDHLLHPINGIIWSQYIEDECSQQFGGSLNLFKPSFHEPIVESFKDGSTSVIYWQYDLRYKVVRNHRVLFDKNGNITERIVLNSSSSQFYNGLSISLGVLAVTFASYYCLCKSLESFIALPCVFTTNKPPCFVLKHLTGGDYNTLECWT
ncbi:putative transmembrane protein [Heterostelium album PN500]|uniref:Putative transmembrane protein n=1 Tax=Heterostelium pallidum (strain ATCC 26659 / Pp 5 / PN500) TaxID=670386 RepID=D3BHN4_HETP5|nr:putative transmembrane protein [Heterostelium album PN500]EFA79211.1 putative transmembrane protein [Heterostelium album PN500]|eukprot:XP_020431332.1 putative transmembrane protein [Heterostelium album PN500]